MGKLNIKKMKIVITVLLLLFLTLSVYSQEKIFIDEKGDTISKDIYRKKWSNKDLLLSVWSHKDENGKIYYTLKKDLYLKGLINYDSIIKKLEKVTNKKFKNSNTLLIEYYFKDDLCTQNRNNKWSKSEISSRKSYTTPIKKELEKKEIAMIVLFDNDIILKNKPKRKNEYYYKDINNYFKNKFFKNPTTCGSFALIKPNGQYIIRNGEYRADFMAQHLKTENWKIFFNSED